MKISKSVKRLLLTSALAAFNGCGPTPAQKINGLAQDMANQLVTGDQTNDGQLTIGFMPLTDKSHKATTLSPTLQEAIYADLVRTHRFEVINIEETEKMVRVVTTESGSDLNNPATIAKLHQLKGIQALVTGTITDASSDLNVQCTLTNLTTGSTVSIAQGTISKDVLAASAPDADYGPPVKSDPTLQPIVAPIALYPDPLLACVLPASTFPDQVNDAQKYVLANPSSTDDQISAQIWDPSVQALAHYPLALQQMSGDPQWTLSLGSAYSRDPNDVMAAIQDMRAQAIARNNLLSNPQQVVGRDGPTVVIEPAQPNVIFVPAYDPVLVYTGYSQLVFVNTYAYPIGPWDQCGCDWRTDVIYEGDWHGRYYYDHGYWRSSPNYGSERPWTRNPRFGPAPYVSPARYTSPARVAGRETTLRNTMAMQQVQRQQIRAAGTGTRYGQPAPRPYPANGTTPPGSTGRYPAGTPTTPPTRQANPPQQAHPVLPPPKAPVKKQ